VFEDWSTNELSNFKPTTNQFEHCTHIWSTSCGQTDFCRWNDAPCTTTEASGDVFRPICKQEQTVPPGTQPYFLKLLKIGTDTFYHNVTVQAVLCLCIFFRLNKQPCKQNTRGGVSHETYLVQLIEQSILVVS
jgi:hypothetical protein